MRISTPLGPLDLGRYTLETGVLHFAAMISMLLAWIIWRRRDLRGAIVLVPLMIAIAQWSFVAGMIEVITDPLTRMVLAKLEYASILSVPVLFLGFVLQYLRKNRWVTLRNGLLVAGIPIAGTILAFTNEGHHLIWSEPPSGVDITEWIRIAGSPIHDLVVAYAYILVTIGIVLLVRQWFRVRGVHRARITIIFLGTLFPFVAGIVFSLGYDPIPSLDSIPLTFAITGIIVTYAMLHMRIFNLLPAARENLIENMADGVLVLDVDDRIVDINPAALKAIGISANSVINRPASSMPPAWQAALCPPAAERLPRREVSIDGKKTIYLDVLTTALLDEERHPSGSLIVFRNITRRRESELQLALRANELGVLNEISLAITSGLDLETVLKTLHIQCSNILPCQVFYVALYDETTGVIDMPLYYEETYSVPTPRDIHKNPGLTGFIITTRKTLYVPDTLNPQGECPITPIRLGGDPSRSYIGIPLILRDKVIGVMSVQSFEPYAFNTEQIRLLETVAVEAAIAIENARLYGEVQRLAIIDELTGIYNYRGLMELGRREVERALRFDHSLAALFFDIDKFRNFNNLYSHTVGNIVIKEIAQRCKSVLRSVDVFARYGGDEFVVLLPETTREMALQVAERLLQEAASAKVKIRDAELNVTISIGVAMSTAEVVNIDGLIEKANRAEHRAKQHGNCVVAEEESPA